MDAPRSTNSAPVTAGAVDGPETVTGREATMKAIVQDRYTADGRGPRWRRQDRHHRLSRRPFREHGGPHPILVGRRSVVSLALLGGVEQ